MVTKIGGTVLKSLAKYTCRNGTLESYRFLPSWPFLARPKLHWGIKDTDRSFFQSVRLSKVQNINMPPSDLWSEPVVKKSLIMVAGNGQGV